MKRTSILCYDTYHDLNILQPISHPDTIRHNDTTLSSISIQVNTLVVRKR